MSAAQRRRAAPGAGATPRGAGRGPADARPRRAPVSRDALLDEAMKARETSYSPYSRFAVGAALLSASGRVHRGCNVENASFGLTCCAERTALFKAVSEGEQEFVAIAVTARTGHGAPPCGACRQVLAEFSPDMLVYWRDMRGRVLEKKLSALLPDRFDFMDHGRKRMKESAR